MSSTYSPTAQEERLIEKIEYVAKIREKLADWRDPKTIDRIAAMEPFFQQEAVKDLHIVRLDYTLRMQVKVESCGNSAKDDLVYRAMQLAVARLDADLIPFYEKKFGKRAA